VQVGDIVRLKPEPWRTGRLGTVVGRENPMILHVLWAVPLEKDWPDMERVNQQYLEVVSASR